MAGSHPFIDGTDSIMNIFHTVPAATMVAECIVHIAGTCVSVCHLGAKEITWTQLLKKTKDS